MGPAKGGQPPQNDHAKHSQDLPGHRRAKRHPGNYVNGANTPVFVKVVDAMMDQGLGLSRAMYSEQSQ